MVACDCAGSTTPFAFLGWAGLLFGALMFLSSSFPLPPLPLVLFPPPLVLIVLEAEEHQTATVWWVGSFCLAGCSLFPINQQPFFFSVVVVVWSVSFFFGAVVIFCNVCERWWVI